MLLAGLCAPFTLVEVWHWLDAEGLVLETTSLNGYAPVADRAALCDAEKGQEALSVRRNRDQRRYFPGFFTILAHRP